MEWQHWDWEWVAWDWWRWCSFDEGGVHQVSPLSRSHFHSVINTLVKILWVCVNILFCLKILPANSSILAMNTLVVCYFIIPLILSAFIHWKSSARKTCFALIYSFIYLCCYGLKGIYFVLWIIIQYYQAFLLLLKFFQLSPLGGLLYYLLCPFSMPSSFFMYAFMYLFNLVLNFLPPQDASAHLVFFCLRPGINHFSKELLSESILLLLESSI